MTETRKQGSAEAIAGRVLFVAFPRFRVSALPEF